MFYDDEQASVIISGEELVSLGYKSGNIDNRYPFQNDNFRCVPIPSEVYKKIYGGYLAYCSHDVKLNLTKSYNDLYHTIDITLDTLFKYNDTIRVDMIQILQKFDYFAPPKQSWIAYLKLCPMRAVISANLDIPLNFSLERKKLERTYRRPLSATQIMEAKKDLQLTCKLDGDIGI